MGKMREQGEGLGDVIRKEKRKRGERGRWERAKERLVCMTPPWSWWGRRRGRTRGRKERQKSFLFPHFSPKRGGNKNSDKGEGEKYIARERQASCSTTCFGKRGPYIRKETLRVLVLCECYRFFFSSFSVCLLFSSCLRVRHSTRQFFLSVLVALVPSALMWVMAVEFGKRDRIRMPAWSYGSHSRVNTR